jgi:archaellum component FlaG (FlaF/FlaG flagellin family)
MTLGVSRPAIAGSRVNAGRIGLAALIACIGLSWTAGATDAHATYGKVTIKKVNVGGAAGDSFAFNTSAHLGSGFSLLGGQSWSKTVLANAAPYHTDKVFTVTEPVSAGYELKSLSCSDTDSTTSLAERKATIKVSPNENVTCSFTNQRKATLIIKKSTSPADTATPKTSFNFTVNPGAAALSLTDGGVDTTSVSPEKTYTISEADPRAKGYKLSSLSCTKLVGSAQQAISGAGNVGTRTATVTPAAGDVITCSFINTKVAAALQVVKSGSSYAYVGDTVSYAFAVKNTGDDALKDVAVSDDKCKSVTGPVSKLYGNADDVLDPGEEWKYTCSYVVPAHTLSDVNPVVNTVTATAKDTAYKVVTDTDQHSTKILHPAIDIEKTGPATATAGSKVDYTLDVTNTGDVSFAQAKVDVTDARCDAAPVRTSVNGDASPASLDQGDRWTYACSVTTAVGDATVVNTAGVKGTDAHDRSVTDEDTFTTRLEQPAPPTTTPPVTTPPAVTPAPAQQVAAVKQSSRALPGSAKLRGPGACPSGRVARATVTGKRIAKVTFLVDGRRVRTVTKADSRGRWILPVRLRSLRAGAHRITARVQFTAASGTATKTMNVTVTKCAAGAVSPQFTG